MLPEIIIDAPMNRSFTLTTTIGDLPSYQYYIDASITVEQVVEELNHNPKLPGVVFHSDKKFLGMISRSKIFEWLGRPYGVELFFKKPLGSLFSKMNIRNEIFSNDTLISDAVQKSLSRPADFRYDPLVVSIGDNDLRLLEMNDLLLAQSEQMMNANSIIEKQIEIGKTLSSSLELSKVLNLILEQMDSIIPFSRAAIMLYRDGNMEFAAFRGYPEYVDMEDARVLVNNNDVFASILQEQRPVALEDTTLRLDWQHIPNTAPTRSWLGVPLVQNNEVLGMLSISRLSVVPFTEEEIKATSIFSGQAAIALGNAHLYAEIKKINSKLDNQHKSLQDAITRLNHVNLTLTRRAAQLETSNQISQQVISILDINQLLSKVINIIQTRFNYTWAGVWLMSDEHDSLVLEACTGSSMARGTLLDTKNNVLATQAYRTGEMVCDNNIVKNKSRVTVSGLTSAFSEIAYPLKFQKEILGVLDIQSERIEAFNLDDISVLQFTASQIAIAIHNARLYSKLNRIRSEI